MYENDYMYAIERSDDYLSHYGVRGMKWGVRKAARLMTLNDKASQKRGQRLMDKQYAKAQKKLAKLEKNATKTKKYVRRAALMGAGAAAAGGLAAAGTEGVASGMRKLIRPAAAASKNIGYAMAKMPGKNRVSQAIRRTGSSMYYNAGKVGGAMTRAATAVDKWGKANNIASGATDAGIKALRKYGGLNGNKLATRLVVNDTVKNAKAISNNTIARVGAGVVGAGLAAGAARNAYKAATAKKKAAQFRSEMNKAFAGTKYASGGNRQGKKRRR